MNVPLALEMIGISKQFPGVQALDQVDFAVQAGEIHALIGENGAGKSTLMKILFGAIPKDSGVIRIKGHEVEIRSPADAQRAGVSMVHQELNLVPQMTAVQNIALGREPSVDPLGQVMDRAAMRTETERLLAQLDAHLDTTVPVRRLSIAQRQMIEIAKALSLKADVLVMDEPTSSLTDKEIHDLFRALRSLTAQGVSIVFISHRLEEVFEIADRITVLRDGRAVGTVERAAVRPDDVIRMMVGREVKDMFPKQFARRGDELLRVEHLTIPGVVEDVSLTGHAGEIVGLAGLIGAGRTDIGWAVFGCAPEAQGAIFIAGEPAHLRSPQDAIRRGVGFLTADRKTQGLVLPLAVQNNISLANLSALTRWGVIDFGRRAEAARRSVEDLRIRPPDIRRTVRTLSGGNQQKVVLAKWLFSQARILIFDEPTRGVDVGAKVEIYQLMNKLVQAGAFILMISSELPEIMGMSDRVLVMRTGRLVAEFRRQADGDWPPDTKQEILRYAMGEFEEAKA